MKKKLNNSEKAWIALMTIMEGKPISKIAQETEAHPIMILNMKELGLKAILPKKCLLSPNKKHKKYPYLLKNIKITIPIMYGL